MERRGWDTLSTIAGTHGNAHGETLFHLSGKLSASKLRNIADLVKANIFRYPLVPCKHKMGQPSQWPHRDEPGSDNRIIQLSTASQPHFQEWFSSPPSTLPITLLLQYKPDQRLHVGKFSNLILDFPSQIMLHI